MDRPWYICDLTRCRTLSPRLLGPPLALCYLLVIRLDDALQNKLTNRQVFIVFLLNILIDILAIHLSTSTRPVCDPLALTATYPGLKLITLALSTLHITKTQVRGQLGVYIVGGENFSTNQIARNLIGREKFARTIKGARSPRISTWTKPCLFSAKLGYKISMTSTSVIQS